LGLPVDVPTDGDFGGAFGAARLGLIAATKADFKQVLKPPKTAKTVTPDKKSAAAYQDAYAAYVQIYPATRELNRQ
jgi:xylulokinase